MYAYLIDPVTQTVEKVNFPKGNYREINRLLDIGDNPFTAVYIENNDCIFVDDEGLLKDKPGPFFLWKGYPQPLAGRGLILGTDEEGESISPRISLEEARNKVSWPKVKLAGFDPYPEGTVTNKDHPWGEGIPVIGHRALFEEEGND